MKSIRKGLVGGVLATGAILAAGAGFSAATAADETTTAAAPGGAAPTGPHGPGHWHHHGFGAGHLFQKLNLTADQQASMKAIMTAAKPQMSTLHQQMRANHLKLQQVRPDDPNYGNVVAEVAQTNATLASQRTTQAAELRAQMYAVLTPAQKTQWTALQAQWAANPHRGHWGQPGAPAAQPAT